MCRGPDFPRHDFPQDFWRFTLDDLGRIFADFDTETLEHTENWRTVIDEMKCVLRPGGLLVLTCRGPGFPRHEYPQDFWRFTLDDFGRIFADFDIETLIEDPTPGVLFAGRRSNRPRTDLTLISVATAPAC